MDAEPPTNKAEQQRQHQSITRNWEETISTAAALHQWPVKNFQEIWHSHACQLLVVSSQSLHS